MFISYEITEQNGWMVKGGIDGEGRNRLFDLINKNMKKGIDVMSE